MSKTSEAIERVVQAIEEIAKKRKKDPYELTKLEVLENSDLTEWDLRSLGGLAAIRKANFVESIDLSARRAVALKRAYVTRLERDAADYQYYLEAVATKMDEILAKHPIQVAKVKPERFSHKVDDMPREVVAFISDTHFGLNIDHEEVPSNRYNWTVAARRMGKFTDQIATYKIEHRGATPTLRLCLGGDLAQGIIHLNDAGTDLITNQVLGTADILVKMIDHLRKSYREILVEAVPCNHLRLPHKGPDRASAQKWDAFSTMIHAMLQLAYRGTDQIKFNVPKTPWADFEVLGHRIFLTHGDTVLEVGNPGENLNVAKITNQVSDLNASVDGKRYEVVMVGHVHRPLALTLDNGVELVVNGTGSGVDPFAQSIGYYRSCSVQTLFEATEAFAVGDYRKIHLNDATDNPKWERIVSPWNKGLVLDKLLKR